MINNKLTHYNEIILLDKLQQMELLQIQKPKERLFDGQKTLLERMEMDSYY